MKVQVTDPNGAQKFNLMRGRTMEPYGAMRTCSKEILDVESVQGQPSYWRVLDRCPTKSYIKKSAARELTSEEVTVLAAAS